MSLFLHGFFNKKSLAGVPGFEPGNAGTKNRCLTAWLYPTTWTKLTKNYLPCQSFFMETCFTQLLGTPLTFLRELKLPAQLVGGAVRDALIGQQTEDIDVAVALLPDEMVNELNKKKIPFVRSADNIYGVCTIKWQNYSFDLAPLRRDISCDGRQATKIEFGVDFKEDANRRDFTFNAIYVDQNGKVTDYFGGIDDLRNGYVKFIGSPMQRLEEDHLRLWRYIRFLAHFGKKEPSTELAITIRKALEVYPIPSMDRIKSELLKTLNGNYALNAITFLRDIGGARALNAPYIDINTLKRFYDYSVVKTPKEALATLGAWTLTTFQWSKEDLKRLKTARRIQNTNDISPLYLEHNLKNFLAIVHLSMTLINAEKSTYHDFLKRVESWPTKPVFPIETKEIITLGFQGEEIGKILNKTKRWWAENDFTPDHQACLDYIMKHIR